MKRLLFAVPFVVALLAPAGASAHHDRTTDHRIHGALLYPGMACGVTATDRVDLGPRASGVRVERPVVGQAVHDWMLDHVATVSRVDVERGPRSTAVVVTLTGAGVQCQPPDISRLGEGGAVDGLGYTITYSVTMPKGQVSACDAKIAMFWTRANVRSNGHTPCARALRIARQWRGRQYRCRYGFCPRMRVSGFRCAFHSDRHSLWVNCRRGRQFVQWVWGD